MASLQGNVAVITGAASGIGRELAILLAKHGCTLAIADIDEKGLAQTAESVAKHGVEVSQHHVDVSDQERVFQFADEVAQQHGHIHIVINNAGVTVVSTFEKTSLEDFQWLMGINFWGVVYGCKAFLPYLKKEPQAYLINISSVFGLISVPRQSAYNAAKFAVRGFTESLRQELANSSVSVSCVHPGGIKTDIARNARHVQSADNPQKHDELVAEFDKMARTTAEEAASVIVKGFTQKRPRILIGKDAWLIDRIQRWFPVSYTKLTQRAAKRKPNK